MKYELTPARKAHMNALFAWNGEMTDDLAASIVGEKEYSELDGISYAETSITAGLNGIKDVLLGDKAPANLTPETDLSNIKLSNDDETYDKVILILAKIHDNWVKQNAKKYDRGNEAKSEKKLYQHLPSALIGLDEISIDLMFLAPFLEQMGIETGNMELTPYGTYKPNDKLSAAYERYVKNYKKENNIETKADLTEHIEKCINGGYPQLTEDTENAEKRREYMIKKVPLLVETVGKKGTEFGKLPNPDECV